MTAPSITEEQGAIPGWIYFISLERVSLVKIGFEGRRGARKPMLQTASPFEMEYVDQVVGSKDEEAFLHKLFARHHYTREWFRFHVDIWTLLEDFEDYRRETFERKNFRPGPHNTFRSIWVGVEMVPLAGFLRKHHGYRGR